MNLHKGLLLDLLFRKIELVITPSASKEQHVFIW